MSLSKSGLASTLKRKLDAEVPSRLSAVSRVLVSVADKALFAQSPGQIRITADNGRSRINYSCKTPYSIGPAVMKLLCGVRTLA